MAQVRPHPAAPHIATETDSETQMKRPGFSIIFIFTALVGVLLVSALAAAEAPTRYEIVELPPLESHPDCPALSNATGINERGDVVGVAEFTWYDTYCHSDDHAVIWRNGEIIDLGGIPPSDNHSVGKGMNDLGDAVVGWAMAPYPGGGWVGAPFFWSETSGMIQISEGSESSPGWAWGVNNAHQVAVTYGGRPYLWDETTGLKLIEFDDSPEGYSSDAWEINNNGIVVGAARRADLMLHAFRYDSSTDTIEDLHDVTYRHSDAYGLNDGGDVAGWMEAYDNFIYPTIWPAEGGRIDLPAQVFSPNYAYCRAEHINDLGDAVGRDVSAAAEPAIAWVAFDVLGGNTDRVRLADLLSPEDQAQWLLSGAFEINNSRQITGTGLFNGLTRGYLMTPVLFEDGFESGTTDGWSVVQP